MPTGFSTDHNDEFSDALEKSSDTGAPGVPQLAVVNVLSPDEAEFDAASTDVTL